MQGLILSLQFFTRIPIMINIEFTDSNLKKAFFFLPFVGALIGGICAVPICIIPNRFSDIVAITSLILYLVLTGGLHIDGLADTADGFFSARSEKEKVLEIMSDSRIGSYGTIAIFILLLCKFVLFKNIAFYTGNIYSAVFYILILSGIISRLAGLGVVIFSKQAKEKGLGVLFHKSASPFSFYFWLLVVFSLCFFFPELSMHSVYKFNFSINSIIFRLKYFLIPILIFLVTWFIVRVSYKKTEGTTGDVNGCVVEVTEVLSLFLIFFFFKFN